MVLCFVRIEPQQQESGLDVSDLNEEGEMINTSEKSYKNSFNSKGR